MLVLTWLKLDGSKTMKLIRKQSAPLITDRFSIQHPDLCVKYFAVPEDKKTGWLEIHCGYYHNQTATEPLYDSVSGFNTFVLRSEQTGPDGWPTYPSVLNDIQIGADGTITTVNSNVATWLLNQTQILDCEGSVS